MICNLITIKIEETDLVYVNFLGFFLYSVFLFIIIRAVLELFLGFIGFGECYVFFLIKSITRKIFSYESL